MDKTRAGFWTVGMRTITFVVGASATGKSDFAVELAKKSGAVIVNCDSQQVYKELNVGTAKPSPEQKMSAPHFFYDFVEPGEQYTAGEYRRDVLAFLDREKTIDNFVFVGGSGFYVHSLLTHMYSVGKADEKIREKILSEFAQNGLDLLYEELKAADPNYAEKIGSCDKYRLLRSVEILRATGKTPSALYEESAQSKSPLSERGFTVRKIGLAMSRDLLRGRVKQRAQKMINDGLIEETKNFLERNLAGWRPLNSVGYKEVREWLAGRFEQETLVDKITISTMQLCKRQHTWFRRDPEINWIDASNALDTSNYML